MQRRLEAEVMDIPERAEAYARADFGEVNAAFVERLLECAPAVPLICALDLGTGPAEIPLRVHAARPEWRIWAVDASMPMLQRAAERPDAVCLVRTDAGQLPFPERAFDVVFSNSLLHHLPNPAPLWEEIARVLKPEGFVFVRDLLRPDSEAAAREIVERHAPTEHPLLKEDFYHSLLAAFRLDEVKHMIAGSPLPHLRCAQVSDRHFDVWSEG